MSMLLEMTPNGACNMSDHGVREHDRAEMQLREVQSNSIAIFKGNRCSNSCKLDLTRFQQEMRVIYAGKRRVFVRQLRGPHFRTCP